MPARRIVVASVLASLALTCALPSAALGWGDEGHRIVARIAYERIDPHDRPALDRLLPKSCSDGAPIECAAVWPDQIKDQRPDTRRLHYVDVALGETPDVEPSCNCIVSAIADDVATLRNPSASLTKKREATRFLVHFLGDLHQPLHATTAQKIDPSTLQPITKNGKPVYDRGGNDFQVTFFEEDTIPILDRDGKPLPMELHWVWDSSLLEHKLGTKRATDQQIASYAAALAAGISDDDAREWQQGDVQSWLAEVHAIGEANAYRDAAGQPLAFRAALGDAYYERNIPVVERQLQKAGVRLASMLTDALHASAPPPPSSDEVYVNKGGHAYHRKGCRYQGPSSTKTTVAKAQSAGRHACRTCRPPE